MWVSLYYLLVLRGGLVEFLVYRIKEGEYKPRLDVIGVVRYRRIETL